jgi:hypothetical protein
VAAERFQALSVSARPLALGTGIAALSARFNVYAVIASWDLLAAVQGSAFADRHHAFVEAAACGLGGILFLVPATAFVLAFPRWPAPRRCRVLAAYVALHVLAAIAAFIYLASLPMNL